MAGLLNPTSRDEVEAELSRAAEAAYGPDRAAELAAEIKSAAGALYRVVTKPLDLRESPPPLG